MHLALMVLIFFGGLAAYTILKRSWIAAGAGLLLIFVALGLTAMWASSMRKNAEQVAAGRPYCLALPSQHRPVQRDLDLTVLVARGDRLSPHMMLWVDQGETVEAYTWSYGRQRFQPDLPFGVLRNCRPRQHFLANLAPAAPGMHISIGQADYVIPPEFSPRHVNDDYITLKFGQESALRATRDSIEWDEQSISRWRNWDTQPQTVAPKRAATVLSEGANGFNIRNFDDQGELVQKFSCNSAKICRLEYFSGPILFNVFMPLTDPNDVPEIRERIEALWDGFRHDDRAQRRAAPDPGAQAVLQKVRGTF